MNIVELLMKHEGIRNQVYDDATGKALKPGMTLIGWPTVGVGRNLCSPGLSHEEVMILLRNDIDEREAGLRKALPWFHRLSETRQYVLVSMAFNMGMSKFLKFKKTLGYIEQGNYKQAAVQMLASLWARQVGNRAKELAAMMCEDQ